MAEIMIQADERIKIENEPGRTSVGDLVPPLEVIVSDHSVYVRDFMGTLDQSQIQISPLRLADGTLRKPTMEEPPFYPDAHYLIRITGPKRTPDYYYQFDKNGVMLSR